MTKATANSKGFVITTRSSLVEGLKFLLKLGVQLGSLVLQSGSDQLGLWGPEYRVEMDQTHSFKALQTSGGSNLFEVFGDLFLKVLVGAQRSRAIGGNERLFDLNPILFGPINRLAELRDNNGDHF